jgi:glycosyltransferase involved in cell wall biosynthesis
MTMAAADETLTGRPKVLFVLNALEYFISHRLPLALAAVAAGWEVHVACPNHRKGETLGDSPIVHHAWDLDRKGANPFQDVASLARLNRIFHEVRPDLVHVITPKATIYGGILARWHRVQGLVCLMPGLGHLGRAEGVKGTVLRILARWGYHLGLSHRNKRVIFQNVEDQELFLAQGLCRPREACLIRGSGIDLDGFALAPEPPGPPLVVFASRLLQEKGLLYFVEAAHSLKAKGNPARFALVGEPDPGNPSSVTGEQLAQWEREGLEVWGFRADMAEVFRACHVVCLPTYRREGIPKVLIEAAAGGRPIVTTDTPGCRDVVVNGLNGLLVPPRDASALAAALEQLLGDAALRSRMGEAGRARAENEFSMAKVNGETLGLYDTLCPRTGPTAK